MIKKLVSMALVCVVFFTLTACKGSEDAKTNSKDEKKNIAVTTSFLADMVEQIAGDKVSVKSIVPAGDDPHLYVAKPDDVNTIKNSDLLLYHGLHFEGKMQEILEKKGVAVTKNFKKEEVGKMQDDGKQIIDPHFWFDIELYKKAVDVVNEELSKLIPESKVEFMKKTEEYKAKLDKLNQDNKKKLEEIPEKHRFLVTPHDAFNYFARSYKIKVVAPQGVSTDSEISNKDIDKTADLIVKNKIKAIFSESTTNPERMKKLQEIVKSKGFETKVVSGEGKELFSDSLAPKGKIGSTFIDMYQHNINLIYNNLK